jgi:hypothetical protein
VFREEVKPAKAAAHEKHEAAWPAAFAKANYSSHYVALTSVTGPNEAWFVEGQDSFAAIEKADKEIDEKVYREALGEGRGRQIEIARQAIASSDFQIFALSPKMSYMPKELCAVDPDLWTPKPVTKAPAGKSEPKPKP